LTVHGIGKIDTKSQGFLLIFLFTALALENDGYFIEAHVYITIID